MNRAAIQRILQGTPVAPSAVAETAPADPLTDLLQTPIRNLTAPLAVASSVLDETVFFVANDHQAASVRVQGGVPYAPDEIDVLWALYQVTNPDTWSENFRLIHEAKKRFSGTIIPEGS